MLLKLKLFGNKPNQEFILKGDHFITLQNISST